MNFFSSYRQYPIPVLQNGSDFIQIVFRSNKVGNTIITPGGMSFDAFSNAAAGGNVHYVEYRSLYRPSTYASINNKTFESDIVYSGLTIFSIGKDNDIDLYLVGFGNIYKCINGNFVTLVELRNTSTIINDIVRPEHKYTIAINKCVIGDTKFSNFITKYYYDLILHSPIKINNNGHTIHDLTNVDIMYVNDDAMLSKVLHNETSNENITINEDIINAVINLTL